MMQTCFSIKSWNSNFCFFNILPKSSQMSYLWRIRSDFPYHFSIKTIQTYTGMFLRKEKKKLFRIYFSLIRKDLALRLNKLEFPRFACVKFNWNWSSIFGEDFLKWLFCVTFVNPLNTKMIWFRICLNWSGGSKKKIFIILIDTLLSSPPGRGCMLSLN